MLRKLTYFTSALLVLLLPVTGLGAAETPPASNLVLVLDASGSMWGQIQGENKIVIARRVLQQTLEKVPAETAVGLVAYGHRKKDDCSDIETVVSLGSSDRGALVAEIDSLNPKGMTPITATLQKVFDDVRSIERAVTVVLVSDGIETCGGDPCAAVRDAKTAGVEFVMHVVGFDLGDQDVAQLECAAQAGGGLYLTASNADELASALDQAVEMTAETPAGKLSVKTTAEGELLDTMLKVFESGAAEELVAQRTYTGPETNPRIVPLEDGVYDVEAHAVSIRGKPVQRIEGIEIKDGATVEKTLDFGSGTISVEIRRNGALSDATVNVYAEGTRQHITGSRTYTSATHNPKKLTLGSGTYDVEAKGIEISNDPLRRWEKVSVAGGETVELKHDFPSGELRVGAASAGALVDATVNVVDLETKTSVGAGRTYTSAKTNPKSFDLSPGRYRVTVKPIDAKQYGAKRSEEVSIDAEAEVEQIFELQAAD